MIRIVAKISKNVSKMNNLETSQGGRGGSLHIAEIYLLGKLSCIYQEYKNFKWRIYFIESYLLGFR